MVSTFLHQESINQSTFLALLRYETQLMMKIALFVALVTLCLVDGLAVFELTHSEGYEMGLEFGAAFAPVFKNFLMHDLEVLALIQRYNTDPEFASLIDSIMATQKQFYPVTYEELEGIADGLGVPFEEVAIVNTVGDLVNYWDSGSAHRHRGKGCSDATSQYQGESSAWVHGHNEDWNSQVAKLTALIITPEWTSYCYPGELPGTTFSWNKHGIIMSLDLIYPLIDTYNSGATMGFVMREVLKSTSLDQAISRATQYNSFYGFNAVISSLCDKRTAIVEAIVDKAAVVSLAQPTAVNASYAHFNLVEYLRADQEDDQYIALKQSCFNETKPHTYDQILAFLGSSAPTCPVWATLLGDQTMHSLTTDLTSCLYSSSAEAHPTETTQQCKPTLFIWDSPQPSEPLMSITYNYTCSA
ncbi:hypothetical protein Pelo_13922 [Pelomyxa schiedti]|nr:hypothetical protein Pelo_13922 [Pelomyxa schiedti]